MSYCPKTYEIRENGPSQDFLISHYKSQVLQKTRSAGNFGELQLKFRNLQSELNKLSNENLKLKYELAQLDENQRKRTNDLRKQNEDALSILRTFLDATRIENREMLREDIQAARAGSDQPV